MDLDNVFYISDRHLIRKEPCHCLFENQGQGTANPWCAEEAMVAMVGLKISRLPKIPLSVNSASTISEQNLDWVKIQSLQMAQCLSLFAKAIKANFEDQNEALPIITTELRIEKYQQSLQCYILVRLAVPIVEPDSPLINDHTVGGSTRMIELICDHLPFGVEADYLSGSELKQIVERSGSYTHFGELVRPAKKITLPDLGDIEIPLPWPVVDSDRLRVCHSLNDAGAACIAFRLQAVELTSREKGMLQSIQSRLTGNPTDFDPETVSSIERTASAGAGFISSVQLAANGSNWIRRMAYAMGSEDWLTTTDSVLNRRPRAKRIKAISESDKVICRQNLQTMEFIPWGFFDDKTTDATFPDEVSKIEPLILQEDGQCNASLSQRYHYDELYLNPDDLLDPRRRNARLTNHVPEFSRIRKFLSLEEALALWKLPVDRLDAPDTGLPFARS